MKMSTFAACMVLLFSFILTVVGIMTMLSFGSEEVGRIVFYGALFTGATSGGYLICKPLFEKSDYR